MPDAFNDLPEEAHKALILVAQVYLRRRSQALAPGPIVTMYWQDFYRLYAPIVQRTLRHHFARPMERDDVVQEVWLTIVRKLPAFEWLRGSVSFRAWMGKVIRHKAADMIRRQRRRPGRVLSELDKAKREVPSAQTDPAPWERHCRREAVQAVLAKLRPKIDQTNWHILHLHYWEDLSVPEIAGRLALSTGQVWCRLHRLLRKLRRALDSCFAEDFCKKARQAPARPSVL